MFWLMELYPVSLKSSAVSSRRFWSASGFRMPLASPSGFGSVRRIYFHSHFKVAVSAYLHCRPPAPWPWNHCGCFCSPVLPCSASRSLLGRGCCSSLLGSPAVLSASQRLARPALSVSELDCTCLSSWPALCISGFVCTRFSSPTCVPLFQRSTRSVVGLVYSSFGSLGRRLRQEGCLHDSPLCSGASVGISLGSPSPLSD